MLKCFREKNKLFSLKWSLIVSLNIKQRQMASNWTVYLWSVFICNIYQTVRWRKNVSLQPNTHKQQSELQDEIMNGQHLDYSNWLKYHRKTVLDWQCFLMLKMQEYTLIHLSVWLLFSLFLAVLHWSRLLCPFWKSQHLHHQQLQTEIQSPHQLLLPAEGKLNKRDRCLDQSRDFCSMSTRHILGFPRCSLFVFD